MDKKVDPNKNSVNSPSSSVKMNEFAKISINLGATAVNDLKVPKNPQNIKNSIKTENTPSKNEAENKISETKSKLSDLKELMNKCINKKKLAPGDLSPYFNRLKVADHYMELADEKFFEGDYVRAINCVISADKVMFEVYGNILLIDAEIDSIKG
ncbi:MAG: hypothetical protein MJ203_01065 [archaeon]|nr:hypothetical protein [archaeon]